MATRTVESVEHQCDRDDCDVTHIVEEGKLPPGYSGDALHVEKGEKIGSDDGGFPWYACRATHIRGAVEAVTATANGSNGSAQANASGSGGEDGGGEDEPETADGSSETMVTAASGLQSGERVG